MYLIYFICCVDNNCVSLNSERIDQRRTIGLHAERGYENHSNQPSVEKQDKHHGNNKWPKCCSGETSKRDHEKRYGRFFTRKISKCQPIRTWVFVVPEE